MTDQFSDDSDFSKPRDQPAGESGEDPGDDLLDEGYAPPGPWSGSEDYRSADYRSAEHGSGAADRATGEPLEQRLEQEDPDVEDDWDEE